MFSESFMRYVKYKTAGPSSIELTHFAGRF